jgi:signal transduction histidine kinase
VEHFETLRVRKNGEHFPVSLTISPVRDAAGVIVGASKIARDITELKRISAEREQLLQSERAARGQAERANRMKDDFLATISHELRTPLNAIVGWTQVLRETDALSAEAVQCIDVIERNARVQAQLIEDLLDLSRITSGKLALDLEWADLASVVQDAVASVRPAAEAKRIRVEIDLGERPGGVLGDRRRLQQVIWNLLYNAIKFTPEGGFVRISGRRRDSHFDVAVTDNGRGIAPEFVPYLFERFRQADTSTTRRSGGLGIGLALVKQLTELHGGSVKAESEGEGRGATFTISLPLVARSRSIAMDLAGATSAPMPVEDLAGIRALVVDDDRDTLAVVKRILAARRATVETAPSVEAALKTLDRFTPDVILSDIGMPVHDGYELIRRVRQHPDGALVPAAALSALTQPEDRMRALQAGFQTHLAKPIAPAELVATVRSLAALRRPAS